MNRFTVHEDHHVPAEPVLVVENVTAQARILSEDGFENASDGVTGYL
jgi:hypothetical protein